MAGDQQHASNGTGKSGPSQEERRGLVGQVGPLEVDWPKAAGYYGGIGIAVALGMIELPLGVFIAAVPLFKMLNRPDASQFEWIAGDVLEGAATPVGGSGTPVVRTHPSTGAGREIGEASSGRLLGGIQSIWTDARELASR